MQAPKKMGRPTDNPKRYEVKARVNNETLQILNEYCLKNNKKRSEGIRDGIHKLKDESK